MSTETGLPAALWDERLSTSAVNRFLIQEADMTRKRRCPSAGIYEKSGIDGRFIAIFILDDDAPAPIFTRGDIKHRCPLSVVHTKSDRLLA
jgi:hypothetical protein